YARDIEALLLTDLLDGYMLTGLREFDGTPLQNVDDPNLTLPGAATTEEAAPLDDAALALLNDEFKQILGERITEVRTSTVLRTNPIRLVSAATSSGREMQRVQRLTEREYSVPPKILEINRTHPLIHDLGRLATSHRDHETLEACIEQLYDSALVAEGLHP